jgi:hypothetical protein
MVRLAGIPIVFIVLVVVLASACGSPSPSPSPSATMASGVQGIALLRGPISDQPEPRPGVRVLVHDGDLSGPLVASVMPDAQGEFSADLPPGTYTLIQDSDGAMPTSATVLPGRYATVEVAVQAR